MLKLREFCKKWYNYSLLSFALIMLCFSLAGYCINPENVMFSMQVLQLFLFSVLLSLGICISNFVNTNSILKHTVRFILVYASFVLFFFALGEGRNFMTVQSANKLFTFICITMFFVFVYLVVSAIIVIFKSIINKAANRKLEYKKQFDEIKSEENK